MWGESVGKIMIFALVLCLIFVSCDDGIIIENESSQQVSSEERPMGYEYVINTSTFVYHGQFCTLVDKIEPECRKTTTDIAFYVERGYHPCEICIVR